MDTHTQDCVEYKTCSGHRVKLQRLSTVAGVEIEGMNLATSLSPQSVKLVMSWLDTYQVLVFRNQYLSREAQYRLTASFGPLEEDNGISENGDAIHPLHVIGNIDAQVNPVRVPPTAHNLLWHTDKSYLSKPALLTILHALEMPARGGDTQFSNLYLAYAALDDKTKKRLANLSAVYIRGVPDKVQHEVGYDLKTVQKLQSTVSHPIIHTHPSTGRKLLFVDIHASYVHGQPLDQGYRLLRNLVRHATQDRFIYTHLWRQGDVLIWDNRCLLHRAIPNFAMTSHRRIFRRSMVRGVEPAA